MRCCVAAVIRRCAFNSRQGGVGSRGLSREFGYFTAAVMMISTFMSGLPRSAAPHARTGGLS